MRYANEDKIFTNPNRKEIYEKIKEMPGITYGELREVLLVKNGTLSNHISKLEKADLIVSRKIGIYRRFYPAIGIAPPEIEDEIKKVVRENPGLSQSEIASSLHVTRQVIKYHIGKLLKEGQIIFRKNGRTSMIYVRGA